MSVLVLSSMAESAVEATLSAIRTLRRPSRPVHARVERHAELALAQQRIVHVSADVAAEAAAFSDVVGGAFVVIDSKDKGVVDSAVP